MTGRNRCGNNMAQTDDAHNSMLLLQRGGGGVNPFSLEQANNIWLHVASCIVCLPPDVEHKRRRALNGAKAIEVALPGSGRPEIGPPTRCCVIKLGRARSR